MIKCPTPTCLAGPYWRPERWALAARAMDVPVKPLQRRVRRGLRTRLEPQGVGTASITVVGQHSFGGAAAEPARLAQRLAEAAGCDLLAVKFDGPERGACFVEAHPWPDLVPPDLADAALKGEARRHCEGSRFRPCQGTGTLPRPQPLSSGPPAGPD